MKIKLFADGGQTPNNDVVIKNGVEYHRIKVSDGRGGYSYTYTPVAKKVASINQGQPVVNVGIDKNQIRKEQEAIIARMRQQKQKPSVVKAPLLSSQETSSTQNEIVDVNLQTDSPFEPINFSNEDLFYPPQVSDPNMGSVVSLGNNLTTIPRPPQNYALDFKSKDANIPYTQDTPEIQNLNMGDMSSKPVGDVFNYSPQSPNVVTDGNFTSPLSTPPTYENINMKSKEVGSLALKLQNDTPEKTQYAGQEVNPSQKIDLSRIFTNPMFGQSPDLQSELFAAGQSFAYSPDFLNPEGQQKGKQANTLRGVGAVGASLFGIARGVLSGASYQNKMQEVLKDYYNRQKKSNNTYSYSKDGGFVMEDGGMVRMPFEKAQTNEYISGLPEAMEDIANREVEQGEYILHPDNTLQKVWGREHGKDEGEKVLLEGGTAVISDNLKLTPEQAKECGEKYDVKLKPSYTYAKAIDKYSHSIGLTELNEELERLYKQVKKQEHLLDNKTKEINMNFLLKEIQEIELKRQPLMEKRVDFAAYIFDKQEEAKNPYKQ